MATPSGFEPAFPARIPAEILANIARYLCEEQPNNAPSDLVSGRRSIEEIGILYPSAVEDDLRALMALQNGNLSIEAERELYASVSLNPRNILCFLAQVTKKPRLGNVVKRISIDDSIEEPGARLSASEIEVMRRRPRELSDNGGRLVTSFNPRLAPLLDPGNKDGNPTLEVGELRPLLAVALEYTKNVELIHLAVNRMPCLQRWGYQLALLPRIQKVVLYGITLGRFCSNGMYNLLNHPGAPKISIKIATGSEECIGKCNECAPGIPAARPEQGVRQLLIEMHYYDPYDDIDPSFAHKIASCLQAAAPLEELSIITKRGCYGIPRHMDMYTRADLPPHDFFDPFFLIQNPSPHWFTLTSLRILGRMEFEPEEPLDVKELKNLVHLDIDGMAFIKGQIALDQALQDPADWLFLPASLKTLRIRVYDRPCPIETIAYFGLMVAWLMKDASFMPNLVSIQVHVGVEVDHFEALMRSLPFPMETVKQEQLTDMLSSPDPYQILCKSPYGRQVDIRVDCRPEMINKEWPGRLYHGLWI